MQIGYAMHNHKNTNERLPAANAVYREESGKQDHPVSWRVRTLTYQKDRHAQALFDQYRFDEPWDRPNESKLFDKMPRVYGHPNESPETPPGHTRYRVCGSKPGEKPSTPFTDGGKSFTIPGISEGSSNTYLVVEAAEVVPWMKPEVLMFQRDTTLPKLSGQFVGVYLVLLGDGSVRGFDNDLSDDQLRAWITANGTERVED